MEGTNLVKAQVKLSFTTGGGGEGGSARSQNVLAIRNFQLAQKKAKREFKGMEAVLVTKDEEGRETSVSHKCADMEKLVPQLMGVSPAVLENGQQRQRQSDNREAMQRASCSRFRCFPVLLCSLTVIFCHQVRDHAQTRACVRLRLHPAHLANLFFFLVVVCCERAGG